MEISWFFRLVQHRSPLALVVLASNDASQATFDLLTTFATAKEFIASGAPVRGRPINSKSNHTY
jgi:hypothetical protein